MEEISSVGIDIAKSVFQVHGSGLDQASRMSELVQLCRHLTCLDLDGCYRGGWIETE